MLRCKKWSKEQINPYSPSGYIFPGLAGIGLPSEKLLAAYKQLQRAESIQDRWSRVGAWDLPTLHLVVTSSSAGQSVKMLSITRHELAK